MSVFNNFISSISTNPRRHYLTEPLSVSNSAMQITLYSLFSSAGIRVIVIQSTISSSLSSILTSAVNVCLLSFSIFTPHLHSRIFLRYHVWEKMCRALLVNKCHWNYYYLFLGFGCCLLYPFGGCFSSFII